MLKLLNALPVLALVVGGSLAVAQEMAPAAPEPPLTFTAQDAQLTWGACPEFMPKGCGMAPLHGDPTKKNADIFLKVPPDATIPHHWHTSAERMVLVSGDLHVTYDGMKEVLLRTGSYAYVPAKLGHKAHCGKGAPCVLFIAFEEPVDAHPTKGMFK